MGVLAYGMSAAFNGVPPPDGIESVTYDNTRMKHTGQPYHIIDGKVRKMNEAMIYRYSDYYYIRTDGGDVSDFPSTSNFKYGCKTNWLGVTSCKSHSQWESYCWADLTGMCESGFFLSNMLFNLAPHLDYTGMCNTYEEAF
jgi:hypothetical protein